MSSPAAGFGGVFWARLSVDDRKLRVAQKAMEFVWRPSSSTGDDLLTFAHAFRIHYSAPNGFSFDTRESNVDRIVDEPLLDTYNVDKKVRARGTLACARSMMRTQVRQNARWCTGQTYTLLCVPNRFRTMPFTVLPLLRWTPSLKQC